MREVDVVGSASLIDVIASVPIDEALFTTYTLSLAWFETHLLRSLERQGANRIVLLADPVGVDSSLQEGLVSGSGVRYAVEPVSAPNGAFHAKIGLMWSKDKLVLAIGSGNLTFAGMHRNLEQWEMLTVGIPQARPERHLSRDVCTGLVQFLEHLKGRVEPTGRAAHMVTSALAAVERLLPSLPPGDGSVQWIDSTREPIGEQFVRRLRRGANRRLQVLSPFHDSDGRAVHRLADELGASLEILYTGTSTTYPIGTKATRAGLTAARLEFGDARPLHAKVFHVRDLDTSHILTGSANATSRALWTTGNIEVSLLRQGKFDALLPTVAGVPEYTRLDFPKPETRPIAIAWAKAGEGHVRVCVRWASGSPPEQLCIEFVDALDAPTQASWPPDGILRVPLPASFNSMRPRALRIQASAMIGLDQATARAWVAFDSLLDASREYRAAVNAWNRLVSGEATDPDDDDAALLQVFGEEHARTIDALGGEASQRKVTSGAGTDEDADEVSIPLRLIDAIAQLPLPSGSARDPITGTAIDDVQRAMRAAFQIFGVKPTNEEDAVDESDMPTKPKPKRLSRSVRQALDDFEDAFVDAASELVRAPANPARVLAYAALCMRLVLRYRLNDQENADKFWASTEKLVRALLLPLSARAPLLSLLATEPVDSDVGGLLALLVALLMWRDVGVNLGNQGLGTAATRREALREALAVLDRATNPCPEPAELPAELDDMCAATPDQLSVVLADARALPCPSDGALVLKRRIEAAISGALKPTRSDEPVVQAARRTPPLFVMPWIETCPRCHCSLAGVVRSRLLRRQPVECLNGRCARWLVPSEGV